MEPVGQPTKRWAVEAVWIANEEDEPATFEVVAGHIAEVQGTAEQEAMERVLDAIRLGEVEAYLTDEGDWNLRIDARVARQVARRHRFWATVRTLVTEQEWRTDVYNPEVLDEALRRVEEGV